jgi:hypothetical protein
LEVDQRKAIQAVWEHLSEWEQAVLSAAMEGEYGWQARVAADHINPETGKPYSRMAPAVAINRIKEKVLSYYSVEEHKRAA